MPSRLIAARFSGSMNVPPPVATTVWRMRQQQAQDLALDGAEVRLAVPGEDVRHRPPLARLDQLVDVLGAPAESRREHPRHRRLARRHESDEIDLIGRHRDGSAARSSSKNPDTTRRRRWRRQSWSAPDAPVAAMANAMASR